MPTFLADVLKQVRGIWARLDAGQRTTIGAVLLATVAGLGVVVWYSGRPVEQVLFTARDAAEMRQAERALSDAGVPFRADGSRLLVDGERYGEAGQALRAIDLDVPDLDKEISALGSVTLDTASRKAVLDRLKIHRLEATVREIHGVRSARIEASKPARSLYRALEGKNRPRASVVLDVDESLAFRRIAQAAIVQVSTSLGIPEADVRAIDARSGQVVGGDFDDPERALGADDFMSRQAQIAEDKRQKAQAMLDQVYRGKAFVSVSVELDPRWERRTEKLQPRMPALVSEDRIEEGGTVPLQGAAGNPASGGAAPVVATPTRTQESRNRVYEPFSGTLESGLLAPQIRSIQVALALDASLSDKRDQIVGWVEGAVGRPSEGEPVVEVLIEDFPSYEDTAAGTSGTGVDGFESWWLRAVDLAPHAAQVLAVLAGLWFLRSLLRRSQPAPRARPAVAAFVEARSLNGRGEAGGEESDPAAQLRRDIERSIVEDPAAMSRMLESWLAEQKA